MNQKIYSIDEVTTVSVFFDYKQIKKQNNLRLRDEVHEVICRIFDEKIVPMIAKVTECEELEYFAFEVWNDQATRKIGQSLCVHILNERVDEFKDLLKGFEVRVIK